MSVIKPGQTYYLKAMDKHDITGQCVITNVNSNYVYYKWLYSIYNPTYDYNESESIDMFLDSFNPLITFEEELDKL